MDTRDKGNALYNKSNLDVDKWATWLMLCYFGNFGGSNPPPPTSDVEINRVLVTVLQEMLLKQMDNGAFEPKKLKREKVKEVLLSFRRNLQNVGSECTKKWCNCF